MKFDLKKNLSKFIDTHLVFKRIDVMSPEFRELYLGLDTKFESLIVEYLNSIADQCIEHINFDKFTYTIGEEELHLTCLCTAEKIFLVSILASIQERDIVLYRALQELEPDTGYTFLSVFKDSNNITLIEDTDIELDIIRKKCYG